MQNQPQFRMPYIWMICLVAAMGGLLFGYDWVVIGGAKPFFEPDFGLSTASERGWANSCALVGCLLGAVLSGGLSDRFGRKRLLVLAALLFTITSIGTALAANFPSSSPGGSPAAWPSAWRRTSRPCTSPRCRRPRCGGCSCRSTN